MKPLLKLLLFMIVALIVIFSSILLWAGADDYSEMPIINSSMQTFVVSMHTPIKGKTNFITAPPASISFRDRSDKYEKEFRHRRDDDRYDRDKHHRNYDEDYYNRKHEKIASKD